MARYPFHSHFLAHSKTQALLDFKGKWKCWPTKFLEGRKVLTILISTTPLLFPSPFPWAPCFKRFLPNHINYAIVSPLEIV